jgi:hypothetical protein
MPYSIKRISPKCWEVLNTETGEIHSKCATKSKAEAQVRLLYGVESGKNYSKKKEMSVDSKKRAMNPWVLHVKAVAKQKGISYREALKVAKATYKK